MYHLFNSVVMYQISSNYSNCICGLDNGFEISNSLIVTQ